MKLITGIVLRTFTQDTCPVFYAGSNRAVGQIVVAAPGFGCGVSGEPVDMSER